MRLPWRKRGSGDDPTGESDAVAGRRAEGAEDLQGAEDLRRAEGAEPPAPGSESTPAAGSPASMPQAPSVVEPTPVIPVSESSFRLPPGTAIPSWREGADGGTEPPPEVLAGAAFAGGLVVAMLLRRVLS